MKKSEFRCCIEASQSASRVNILDESICPNHAVFCKYSEPLHFVSRIIFMDFVSEVIDVLHGLPDALYIRDWIFGF